MSLSTTPSAAHPFVLAVAVFGLLLAVPASGQDQLPTGSAMPGLTSSLTGSTGTTTLADLQGEAGTVVVFWSNRCPWGGKLEKRLLGYVQRFSQRGIATVLINSNDASAFAKESAAENAEVAARLGVAVVADANGALAAAFGATRNPAFFLFDGNHTLVYSGNFDDSPGDEGAVENSFLEQATLVVLDGSGQQVSSNKAFGCRITPAKG